MSSHEQRMTDAFAIPELTRSLRTFAMPQSLGEVHDRFFAPLIDARRAAANAPRWNGRVLAFDARRLEATMRMTLEEFARDRHPQDPAESRALAAQLQDACAALFAAIGALGEQQQRVAAELDDAGRAKLWDAWVAALREVFVAADSGWAKVGPMLSR